MKGATDGLSHAHHVFAKKFRDTWNRLGINFEDPANGAWWEVGDHLRNAYGYNRRWENWIAANRELAVSRDDGPAPEITDGRKLAEQIALLGFQLGQRVVSLWPSFLSV